MKNPIMSESGAIICALEGGIKQLKDSLQSVADVATGEKLTETDKKWLKAAEEVLANEGVLEAFRTFQREARMDGRLIRERDGQISRLQRQVRELEEENEELRGKA